VNSVYILTIKEIAERAGLDRKTFYRHFHSKEEVLYLQLQDLCQIYIEELKELPELSAYLITKSYFSICAQYSHFFKLLERNELLSLVLLKFNEYLPALNNLFLDNPSYRNKPKYELMYQAGGFWNVTNRWIRDGMKESPERMAEIVSAIMPSPIM